MPKKKQGDPTDRSDDLLEKLLVFQLHAMGTPQVRIAKLVGRQKAWVNKLVRDVPRGGRADGGKAQGKKAKR